MSIPFYVNEVSIVMDSRASSTLNDTALIAQAHSVAHGYRQNPIKTNV